MIYSIINVIQSCARCMGSFPDPTTEFALFTVKKKKKEHY